MTATRTARLTVVIPFYNETAFLRLAVSSVMQQSMDSVDLIVVNDNPQAFSEQDIRALGMPNCVRILSHDHNRGLSAARNTGIDAAQGDFVGFLDADDYYTQTGLKRQFDYACATSADITHAQTCFTRQGSPIATLLKRDADFFGARKGPAPLAKLPEAQFIVSSWSSIYRKDFLQSRNLRFDEEQRKFEDRLFVLDCVTRADSIAFLGEPTRIWRRRAGSISVTRPDPTLRQLQLNLLEKCVRHIRAEVRDGQLPPQYERRELFNTVSRLIWDLDLLESIARSPETPENHTLSQRIMALLGDQRFSHAIFDDPIITRINRTGMMSRHGRVRRVDFFAIHKALAEGDPVTAWSIIQNCEKPEAPRLPKRPRSPARLVLHMGLHKTGTTYIQHNLEHHREALRSEGVLVPETGWATPEQQGPRNGALPGHQGFVAALRKGDTRPFDDLHTEIIGSGANTVLLSCENMLFPTTPDREDLISALADHLGPFSATRIVLLARAPHAYLESFYRERVTAEHRAGCRSFEEFLVDYQSQLTDLPGLLEPLESTFDVQAEIGDFDTLAQDDGLWPGFCRLAGLPPDLAPIDATRYPSPDRATIGLLRMIHALVPDTTLRQSLIASVFAQSDRANDKLSLVSPRQRAAILQEFAARSAAFARTRGYTPDYTAMRAALDTEDWRPLEAIPMTEFEDVLHAALRAPPLFVANAPPQPSTPVIKPREDSLAKSRPAHDPAMLTIRLKPRPWLQRLMRKRRTRS